MTSGTLFDKAVEAVRRGASPHTEAQKLLEVLTTEERLSLLDGDTPFFPGLVDLVTAGYNRTPYCHGAVPRVGIPGIRFSDGPRGICVGSSTAFPVAFARGATWDLSLEERVGTAVGREGRAQGVNFWGGVCVNLPRHPSWGRHQETYGDDPYLLGEFGAACTSAVQRHLMACVKHYALNSMENARFQVDVTADDATLHEVYLPHFKRVVDEGCAAVMSSYNSVNGEWAGQSRQLLVDILRTQWGLQGFTISDFIFGFRDPVLSLKNGLDVEAPFAQQRAHSLPKALKEGRLSNDEVNTAGSRIIATQLQHIARRDEQEPDMSVVYCQEHKDLAREVASRSMVLLKNSTTGNGPILPIARGDFKSYGLIGRLANFANIGDRGSSTVKPPHVVTPSKASKPQYQTQ